jgi:signal transduction histidine kinase
MPLASGRDGGHGIGLAAAHSIVELHGGEIEVATAPGEGTRFRVRLPAVEE